MKVGFKIYLLYFIGDVTCSCVINILEKDLINKSVNKCWCLMIV